MIIWGTRRREKELATGQFYCPQCQTTRTYKHKSAGMYFTLYFIPLFQVKKLGEYVVCQTCNQAYKPEVLSYKAPTAAEKLMRAVRGELENGLPLHMLQQKLIASGVEQATATQAIEAASAGAQVKCPKCGFTYYKTVKLCANCGTSLTA